MTNVNVGLSGDPALQKPLRVWPGVVLVTLQWVVMFAAPRFAPDQLLNCIIGAMSAGVLILLWWTFLSRAAWVDRLGAIALIIISALVTTRFIDKSVATGMMGMMFPFFAVPVLSLALVAGAVIGRGPSRSRQRRVALASSILLGCVVCALVRTNGLNGEGVSDLAWRWSKTHEDRLVAQASALPAPAPAVIPAASAALPVMAKIPTGEPKARITEESNVLPPKASAPAAPIAARTIAGWPGFRGPGRDSIIPGVRIETNWSATPPVQLWRRPIGPGWGSFAVSGDLIYTQEQRAGDEIVACYNAATGNPVWAHRDAARFWESNAGAGPRATPTLHDGRVYTLGATGIVNALDAQNGAVVWSHNAGTDAGMEIPGWGFAGSPLVAGDMVIVAAAGKLVAYDAATGARRWVGPTAGDSYSSPHLATFDGVEQVVLLSSLGAASVSPADGTLLWKYAWPSNTRIMQPAVIADGLLMTVGDAMGGDGMRRIAVSHGPAGWTTEERWTSRGLKPGFNDFVVYDGHVFGFDGSILACLDLADGKRAWKGGRYGAGQMVLLRDQGVLLVLSEEGELALVKAATDQFTELARFPALEGKTWNHPVLTSDRLLVRNGTEMVAFRLALAAR